MTIFVAGASGVIGRPLVAALRRAAHRVVGLTRSHARAAQVEALGATAVVGDALDRSRLVQLVGEARPDVVVHQVTSIPHEVNPRRVSREFAATNRLRREGTRNLVAAAAEAGTRIFVAQSIAFAYASGGTALRTESDPLFLDAPESYVDLVRAVADLEQTVLGESRLIGVVLRYGFLYGPGTVYAQSGSFFEAVRRRQVPIIGDGAGVFSFVHVDDAAVATVLAIESGRGGVYNIVDDDPARVSEWLPEYAEIVGGKPPLTVPRFLGRLGAGAYGVHMMTAMAGASNQKARSELHWTPRYSSWRDGMQAELSVGVPTKEPRRAATIGPEREGPGLSIPPPVMYLAALLIGIGLDAVWPFSPAPGRWGAIAGIACIIVSVTIMPPVLLRFRGAHTPFDVRKAASALIVDGPYRFSRHPSYVALTLLYFGVAFLLNSGWILLLALPLLLVMDRWVVRREEHHLETRFGDDYRRYKGTVRRWL